ncbi:hypothetical protein [Shimia sp. R11_0]|nr:hypothetical protein [Shimia sp. R11_0]
MTHRQASRRLPCKGETMQGTRSKIQLVILTIGAERGRAARGRP